MHPTRHCYSFPRRGEQQGSELGRNNCNLEASGGLNCLPMEGPDCYARARSTEVLSKCPVHDQRVLFACFLCLKAFLDGLVVPQGVMPQARQPTSREVFHLLFLA